MNKRSDSSKSHASFVAKVFSWSFGAVFVGALTVAGCTPSPAAPATCGAGLTTCGATCTNLTNNASNCGMCGKACATGQVCDKGACTSTCSAGTMICGSSCSNTLTDQTHCGNCTTVCRADQACNNGSCGCAPGQTLCNGVCAATCGTPGTGGASTGSGGAGTGTGGSGTGSGGAGTGTGGAGTGTGGSGTGTGGTATGTGGGGATGTGGTATGTGGGGGSIAGNPPGYWSSGTWRGCAWTGVDIVAGTTTSNTPRDFLTKAANTPYCMSGTVHAAYESVSLLGFNLNETPTGSATQCAYKPTDPTLTGPPGVTLTGTGLAISFSKNTGSNLRVQIQGPDGGKAGTVGENNRWCYTITEVQGPVFVPFSKFNTRCWAPNGTPAGMPYMNQPISAVVFLVPGLLVPSPFNYCIGGFAAGTSVAAAPAYTPTPPNPVVTGTLGGALPSGANSRDLDFQKVKVAAPGPGGKTYIVQNNNWGGDGMFTNQTLQYTGNSFRITMPTGAGPAGMVGVPASFPSIYIGNYGDTQNLNDPPKGVYSTSGDDNLPRQISAITALNTTMRYNRASGDYNACYDIWVAAGAPTSIYEDAISGFVMVWLYRPPMRSPIGSMVRTATIAGNTYEVWVGPRGTGTNPNRPVVSYVATTTALSRTFDLKPILADAAMNGIPSNWFVTDVFGGFEIWNGAGTTGLELQEFTAVVQ